MQSSQWYRFAQGYTGKWSRSELKSFYFLESCFWSLTWDHQVPGEGSQSLGRREDVLKGEFQSFSTLGCRWALLSGQWDLLTPKAALRNLKDQGNLELLHPCPAGENQRPRETWGCSVFGKRPPAFWVKNVILDLEVKGTSSFENQLYVCGTVSPLCVSHLWHSYDCCQMFCWYWEETSWRKMLIKACTGRIVD